MQINIFPTPIRNSKVVNSFFKPTILAASMALLSACGGSGSNSSFSSNIAPNVTVPDEVSVIELSEITINAAPTDIDGSIASVKWTQTQGNSASIQGANS